MSENILAQIIDHKKSEIEAHKKEISLEEMKQKALSMEPFRGPTFLSELIPLSDKPVSIIAECKKSSPSKGVICENYEPEKLAKAYQAGGASCISVLTDEKYFGGHLSDIAKVRSQCSLPVLRKDFIIDEYQIWQARAYGAHSFLLLSGPLDQAELQYYIEIGRECDMEPLVECHTEDQLSSALATDAKIIGINNRNLSTFDVDLERSKELAGILKKHAGKRIAVCESGVKTRDDVVEMQKAGFSAFLIGETLVKSDRPAETLAGLLGHS